MKKQISKLAVQRQVIVKFNFNIIEIINTAIGDGDDNKTLNSTRI